MSVDPRWAIGVGTYVPQGVLEWADLWMYVLAEAPLGVFRRMGLLGVPLLLVFMDFQPNLVTVSLPDTH